MPFKSKAQVRKFDELLKDEKITQAQFNEWHAQTKNIKRLPERVKKKKKKISGFDKGFKKVALDMAGQAATESGVSMTDFVPGTSLRADAETGQSRGGAQNTISNDKQYSSKLKTKYDTSRFGRRQYVS